MSAINAAVESLPKFPSFILFLQDLGFSHAKRGVLPIHYQVMGQALILTLKAGLKTSLTDEGVLAW